MEIQFLIFNRPSVLQTIFLLRNSKCMAEYCFTLLCESWSVYGKLKTKPVFPLSPPFDGKSLKEKLLFFLLCIASFSCHVQPLPFSPTWIRKGRVDHDGSGSSIPASTLGRDAGPRQRLSLKKKKITR